MMPDRVTDRVLEVIRGRIAHWSLAVSPLARPVQPIPPAGRVIWRHGSGAGPASLPLSR